MPGYSGDSVHEDEIFKNAQFGILSKLIFTFLWFCLLVK